MNKLITLTFLLSACGVGDAVFLNGKDGSRGKDGTTFDDSRVSDLERRAELNDQLNLIQNALIEANAQGLIAANSRMDYLDSVDAGLQSSLDAEIAARLAGDANLQSLLSQEEAARIAGDLDSANALSAAIATQVANNNYQQSRINALQAQAAAQSLINLVVQGQIASINSRFPTINATLSSLQSQINNTNSNVSSLQSSISSLQSSVSTLTSGLSAVVSDLDLLEDQVSGLQEQLNAEGTKVYKCNSASSSERIFKINNKFYAAMNRVTAQSIQVITGSSSQTVITPLLCKKSGHDDLKLADADGDCDGSSWSPVAGTGTTTTVPSYSTANVTVVTSVKIALDILEGSYGTTDGGSTCYFSAYSSNGSSTNFVQVQ